MKIAFIEDDPICYNTIQPLLEDRGHEVLLYKKADNAVDAIETISKCGVIILDLMMRLGTKIAPDEANETGIALYKRIRVYAPTVRVVVLTAKSKNGVWNEFEGDKNAFYVEKPVSDFEQFINVVKGERASE